MIQYIDKSALVVEINELKKEVGDDEYWHGYDLALDEVLYFIDTLEGKEVDLEKEYKEYVEEDPVYNKLVNGIVGKNIAKYFFELGAYASNPLTWKDISIIREILCGMAGYPLMSDKEFCTEVLKRFKTQKGE